MQLSSLILSSIKNVSLVMTESKEIEKAMGRGPVDYRYMADLFNGVGCSLSPNSGVCKTFITVHFRDGSEIKNMKCSISASYHNLEEMIVHYVMGTLAQTEQKNIHCSIINTSINYKSLADYYKECYTQLKDRLKKLSV